MTATRPLRVDLVIADKSFGGAERLVLTLLDQEAAKARLDVRVIALGRTPFEAEAESRGWPVQIIETGRLAQDILRSSWAAYRLWRADPDVDVVLANGVKPGAVAIPAAVAAGVPVVYFKHDFSLDAQLAVPLSRLATSVACSSPEVAATTTRDDAVVLSPPRPPEPLPRDEARRQLGLSDDDGLVLVCMSRLIDYKGIDDAVRALALAPEWRLVVIGHDDPAAPGEEARLRGIMAELGVADRVTILHYLDAGGAVLSGADALAVLTKMGAKARGLEGWGMVADEALTAGVPVIAARGGGVSDRLEGAGIMVDPAAPEQVADALRRLSDPAVRHALGAEGRRIMGERPTAAERSAVLVGMLAAAARRPGAGVADPPPVSVVVPAYREDAAAVAATIEPLLAQLGDDDELLVVHDPSTDPADDTGAVLDRLAADAGPRMRVLHRGAGSSGISSARNAGIAEARHDRIACTDIGCIPQPGWLDALRAALAETPAPSLATGLYDLTAEGPWQEAMALACYPAVEEARRSGPLARLYGALLGRVFDPTLPTGRSMAFTRAAWASAGGFPESLATAEDVSFGQTIAARGGRAVLAADAVVRWGQRPSLDATARMYFAYGVGDGESGNRLLIGRNLARLAAYAGGLAALASGRRGWRRAALGGAAFYLSVPVARAGRRRADPRAVALIPAALAVKDGAKALGCLRGLLLHSKP